MSRLPPALKQVEARFGEPAALAVANSYSGRCVYVPATMTQDHPIARELGLELAAGLAELYGGEMLDVPRCSELERERRNDRLVKAREAGATISELVVRFGLSRRQVFNVLADHRDSSGEAA